MIVSWMDIKFDLWSGPPVYIARKGFRTVNFSMMDSSNVWSCYLTYTFPFWKDSSIFWHFGAVMVLSVWQQEQLSLFQRRQLDTLFSSPIFIRMLVIQTYKCLFIPVLKILSGIEIMIKHNAHNVLKLKLLCLDHIFDSYSPI